VIRLLVLACVVGVVPLRLCTLTSTVVGLARFARSLFPEPITLSFMHVWISVLACLPASHMMLVVYFLLMAFLGYVSEPPVFVW